MSTAPIESLPTAERRRLIAIGLLRALATTVLVVAAYYLLPLNNLAGVWLGVTLAAGLLALTAVVAYQVRAIIRHPHFDVAGIVADGDIRTAAADSSPCNATLRSKGLITPPCGVPSSVGANPFPLSNGWPTGPLPDGTGILTVTHDARQGGDDPSTLDRITPSSN